MTMFASNQILEISCSKDQLEQTIRFAMELSGSAEYMTRTKYRVHPAFAIINGMYCLADGHMDDSDIQCPDGYTEFPFDYDPDILSAIILQWAEKQTLPARPGTDGSCELGFLIRIPRSHKPVSTPPDIMRSVITIQPYWCTYHK